MTKELARRQPVYVMFILRRDWTNQLVLDCLERLEPVRTWEVDGAPVLWIYRYTPQDAS